MGLTVSFEHAIKTRIYVMKIGNLFHSAGPANAKARFPKFLIDRGIV